MSENVAIDIDLSDKKKKKKKRKQNFRKLTHKFIKQQLRANYRKVS